MKSQVFEPALHLTIENEEAYRIATELVRLRGQSLATVVTTALRNGLAREQSRASRAGIADKLMTIGQAYSRLPDGGPAHPDDVIDYEEHGLPR